MNQDIISVYEKVEKIIENGIIEVINEKSPIYDEYNIVVSNEQQFIKMKEKNQKSIYIVIQYGKAAVNYGQIIMPVTLAILGEQNRLKIAQRLMYDFTTSKNMTYNIDKTIFQVYESPTVSSNFQLMFEGFRSILQVSGSVLISDNANFYGLVYHHNDITDLEKTEWEMNDEISFNIHDEEIKETVVWNVDFISNAIQYNMIILTPEKQIYYSQGINQYAILAYENGWEEKEYKKIKVINGEDTKEIDLIDWLMMNGKLLNKDDLNFIEEVDFVSSSFRCDFIPDTQAFYFEKNFTRSINKFANLGFSITLFTTTTSPLVNDILSIITKKGDVNKSFEFTIKFLKRHSLRDNFKIVSVNADQQIGDMTLIVLTFIN